MPVTAKIEGADRLRAKLLKVLGTKGQTVILKANQKSANEFEALVKQAVPQDPDDKNGHLVDTLGQSQSGPLGVEVFIGGPGQHGYPLHLETGHRARDGSHVAGKPYWFPAKRVVKKSAHARTLRSYRAAIKAGLAGSGGA